MTPEENVENMERCPRFQSCSIPKCPLDYWMNDRIELADEERCVIRGKTKSKRVKGNRSATMRGMSKFVCKKNKE